MPTTNIFKKAVMSKAPCHRCRRGEVPEIGPCLSKNAFKSLGEITRDEIKLRGLAPGVTLTGAAVRRKKKR